MRYRLVVHGFVLPLVACGALLPSTDDPPGAAADGGSDGGVRPTDAAGSSDPKPADAGAGNDGAGLPTSRECVEPGNLCADAGTYCTGDLRCAPCAGEGEGCADTSACCGNGECRPGGAGMVCERELVVCAGTGTACSPSNPCCPGTRCTEDGACVPCLPVSACTNDVTQCCSGALSFRPAGNCNGAHACQ